MFKYKELYDDLRADIDSEKLEPGTKLPTEASLCERGFSRNTVRQALALLEEDGLILKQRGSGSVVKLLPERHTPTGNVALLFTSFTVYIFNDTLNGIHDGLRGWATPVLYSSNAKIEEEERILTELLDKRPDGLIVQAFDTALPNPNLPLYQKLIDNGVPVIFLYGFYEGLTNFLYVAHNDRQGAALAVRYLFEQGRNRIGGIFITEERQFHNRYTGYCDECKQLGIPLLSERILWLSRNMLEKPKELAEEFERLATACDALICTSDYLAEMVIKILLQAGVRIPEELAIISFDNSYLCDYAQVPITSMDAKPYEMGHAAAEKLQNVLNGKQENPLEFSWQLVKRKSS